MEAADRPHPSYVPAWGLTISIALATVWTTIVRDDGSGAGYFMIILATGVAALAARGQPKGMARGLVGVAGMQAIMGLLIATAPVTSFQTDGPVRALVFNGVFATLWLLAAGLFARRPR